VKKTWRQITALSFLAVYGLAVCLVCSYDPGLRLQKNDNTPASEKYHAVISGNLLNAALQPDKTLNANLSSTLTGFKNTFSEFSTLLKAVDHLISSSFIQYSFFSSKVSVRFSRTAIIFPFHYFW